jgi:ubiquinone/menaquinone biosynthesis C-methylase UbiE
MTAPGSAVLRTFVNEHGEERQEVACPLCRTTDAELLFEGKDLLYAKPGVYPVVRCKACTLSYVNPRPTFAALAAHYPDDYFCYVPPDASPALLRPIIESMARDNTLRRLELIERVVGRLGPDAQITDVGCGLNDLLFQIKKERGATGVGVDMKDTMVERIRTKQQMPVFHGTLEQAGFESGRFDLVTMIEYLEHEANPMDVLREARRVLKKGGHLALEIPYPGGWPARAFKNRWSNLDVPRHLVFFDRPTLSRALAEHDLELVSFETFAIPFYIGTSVLFWLGGHDMMRNTVITPLLAGLLGAPFLPALPWLHEFAFAIARAGP